MENESPKRIFWVWLNNLEGHWKDFIDFAADRKCTGVVIWGLDGWKEKPPGSKQFSVDEAFCREVVAYAHARGVQVIHGFGLNGYNEGRYICKQVPAARAVIPDRLKDTKRGKDSVGNIYCPSNPEALKLLREMLLRAADTGIDGFNFETADVDYITCHCPTCEARFQSANETEGTKPPRWTIEQVNWAVNLLQVERPKLWLSIGLAMQSFGQPPYLDSEPIEQLNKEIDPRVMLGWAEGTYPPQPICEKLAAGRDNIGFYLRSAEFKGWEGAKKIKPDDIISTIGRLWTLHPKCFLYRSWWPRGRWVVNLAVAAEAMRDPNQPNARFAQIEAEMERLAAPGQKYSHIENVVPGSLASPAVERNVTRSSKDPRFPLLHVTDGAASPSSDMWATERNNPKEAGVDPFYLKLFEQGKFEFQSGNLPAAVKDFEIAFIGFLDSPAMLLESHVYLTVLHYDLKNVDKSKFYFDEIKKLKLLTYLTAISPPPDLMKKFSDLDSLYTSQDLQARIAPGRESPAVGSASAASAVSGKALEAEIEQLKAAIRKNRQEPAPYFRLSALYLEQKKTEDARRIFEDLIKIYPKDGQAHFELGKIFLQERNLPEAATALQQAALFSPDNHEIYYELGKVLYEQRRSVEAKEAFERVKALNPSYKDTAEYLALIGAAAAKKAAEAQPFLDQARGVKPSKEKIPLYKKAMSLDPSNDQTSYELSLVYLAEGKPKEAAELLEPLVRKHPQEARFSEALATAYLASKDFDKTLALVNQAKVALGEKVELNYLMGKALMGKQRFREAAAEFNLILLAYPGYMDAAQSMAICLKRMR